MLARIGPCSAHERKVTLVDLPFPHLLLEADESASRLREQKDARGLAIEAMREFEERLVRTRHANLLDDAECQAAAAMNRGPCGLVDDEKMLVFEQDRRNRRHRQRRRRSSGCNSQRRNPHPVTEREALVGSGAGTVDPDLAAANDAIDVALRNPFGELQEKVVEALSNT